ncbi:MAG: hypothetical protein ACYTG0_12615 [Planctomycetota bacterium]|jgi:hypothetical protein
MSKLPIILAGAGAAALVFFGWRRLAGAETGRPGGERPDRVYEPTRVGDHDALVDQYGNIILICNPEDIGREAEVGCLRRDPRDDPEFQAAASAHAEAEAERMAELEAEYEAAGGYIAWAQPRTQTARQEAYTSGDWSEIYDWVARDGVSDATARRVRMQDAGMLHQLPVTAELIQIGIDRWDRLMAFHQVQAVKDWYSIRRTQQQALFGGRWEVFLNLWQPAPVVLGKVGQARTLVV